MEITEFCQCNEIQLTYSYINGIIFTKLCFIMLTDEWNYVFLIELQQNYINGIILHNANWNILWWQNYVDIIYCKIFKYQQSQRLTDLQVSYMYSVIYISLHDELKHRNSTFHRVATSQV